MISFKIRYLKKVKMGITYVIFNNYAKIKVNLFNFSTLEKNIDLA